LRSSRPGCDYRIRDLFHIRPAMTDREAPVGRATAAAIEAATNS